MTSMTCCSTARRRRFASACRVPSATSSNTSSTVAWTFPMTANTSKPVATPATLKAAMQARNVEEGFLAALGPLSLGAVVRNEYYPSEDAYMMAVAEAVREEYKAITDGGLIVQVDEPEFATSWMFYPDWSVDQYRNYLEFCVEIINHALEGVPPE